MRVFIAAIVGLLAIFVALAYTAFAQERVPPSPFNSSSPRSFFLSFVVEEGQIIEADHTRIYFTPAPPYLDRFGDRGLTVRLRASNGEVIREFEIWDFRFVLVEDFSGKIIRGEVIPRKKGRSDLVFSIVSDLDSLELVEARVIVDLSRPIAQYCGFFPDDPICEGRDPIPPPPGSRPNFSGPSMELGPTSIETSSPRLPALPTREPPNAGITPFTTPDLRGVVPFPLLP